MKVEINSDGIITVEGLRFSVEVIESALRSPPPDRLFSVNIEDEHLVFTAYYDATSASKFFEK